jgi:hypothetical protein
MSQFVESGTYIDIRNMYLSAKGCALSSCELGRWLQIGCTYKNGAHENCLLEWVTGILNLNDNTHEELILASLNAISGLEECESDEQSSHYV